MTTESLRYTPGHSYAFARVLYREKGSEIVRRWGLFDPKNHDFVGCDIVLLRCERMEHVHWEFDPKEEKKHQGFVFTEVGGEHGGRVFHNQYPIAHFGQLDDSANYRARPARDERRIAELDALQEVSEDEYRQELLSAYEDAFTLLGKLIGATSELSSRKVTGYWSSAEQKIMKDVTESLKGDLESVIGKKIGYRNAVITFTKGKPSEQIDGLLEPYIVEEAKAA